MGRFLIIKPQRPTATNVPRLSTPNPKEAVSLGSNGSRIDFDFGAPIQLDTAFIGYHTGAPPALWSFATTDSYGGTGTVVGGPILMQSPGLGPPYHGFIRLAAPVTSRYWTIYIGTAPAPVTVGVIALGLAMGFTFNPEWGAGQFVEDTGSAERMKGGGFAVDPGVATTGYQWTLGDLTETERRQLFQLVKDRRTTQSLLVVENDDQTDGLNERIHWGLLRKLEPYERLDPLNTKWGFQIQDWA